MGDLQNPRLIYLKGILFLVTGLLSASLLFFFAPQWVVAILLAIAIWSFCRFYYFAFYVIEHYVDREFRFAGLLDFCGYAIKQRTGSKPSGDEDATLRE